MVRNELTVLRDKVESHLADVPPVPASEAASNSLGHGATERGSWADERGSQDGESVRSAVSGSTTAERDAGPSGGVAASSACHDPGASVCTQCGEVRDDVQLRCLKWGTGRSGGGCLLCENCGGRPVLHPQHPRHESWACSFCDKREKLFLCKLCDSWNCRKDTFWCSNRSCSQAVCRACNADQSVIVQRSNGRWLCDWCY